MREIATEFGRAFGSEPRFIGEEAPTGWLADAGRAEAWFGRPTVTVAQMIVRIAGHLQKGGALLDKPTHFETRSGNF